METKESSPDDNIEVVRGVTFWSPGLLKRTNIEDAMDYMPKDGDLIIAAYLKTGSTWMLYIVMQIVSKATLFSKLDEVVFKLNPNIELVGVCVVEALTEPRIYRHHLRYDVVQKNTKSKSVYIYRHPEDVVVSYYHFARSIHPDRFIEFDEFFDDFLIGNMSYGSYFSHVLSFYEHRNDSNVLMVSYEKLNVNTREEILRIAKFLGEEHHACLVEERDVLDKIIEHTSFEYMKKNLYFTNPYKGNDGEAKKKVNFFRKGIAGDGKNKLTEKQQQRLKEAAKETLLGTDIFQEWYKEEI